MVGARQTLRLFRIVQILVRHGLDEFITVLHLFRPYRALLYPVSYTHLRAHET